MTEKMDRSLSRPRPGTHWIVAKRDVLIVDGDRRDDARRHPWQRHNRFIVFVVIAYDEVFFAVKPAKKRVDSLGVAAERKIADMPYGVVWLDALIPVTNQSFIHRVDVREWALGEFYNSRVKKMRVGYEPSLRHSHILACSRPVCYYADLNIETQITQDAPNVNRRAILALTQF